MATKTNSELRLERSDDNTPGLDNRVLTEKRYERVEENRAPTYRTEALHYREDFGTSMDDSQYKASRESQDTFNSKIGEAKKSLAETQASVNAQYNTGVGSINSATAGMPASDFKGWYANYLKTTAVPISLYNGSSYEGTYIMDPESAQSFLKSVSDTNYYKVFTNDKGQTSVDVRGYGKELHDPLLEYTSKMPAAAEASYNKQYAAANAAANKALSIEKSSALDAINTQYSATNESLSQQQAQVNSLVEQNTKYLSGIKSQYKEKLANLYSTISSLGQNGK